MLRWHRQLKFFLMEYFAIKYFAFTIFIIYFPIHSNGMIVFNSLHSWNNFITSNSEKKIYVFYLQHLFNNLSTWTWDSNYWCLPSQLYLYDMGLPWMSSALGVIRRYCNRLWIFCGDYAFRVFDRHPRGKRDIVEDQSKAKLLPPVCTKTFIYDILYCLK